MLTCCSLSVTHRPLVVKGPPIAPRTARSEQVEKMVEAGITRMLESGAPWSVVGRVGTFLCGLLEAYRRCMKDVFWEGVRRPGSATPARRPAYKPCQRLGHERCAPFHARTDLSRWRHAFEWWYRGVGLAIFEFVAPGRGFRDAHRLARTLKNRRPLRRVFGGTIGYLTPTADGVSYRVLVPRRALAWLKDAAETWRHITGDGWVVLHSVPGWCSALDVAVEMRVEAEQALFLHVADGTLDPHTACVWLGESLAKDRAGADIRRVVFGPGFQVPPPAVDAAENGAEQAVSFTRRGDDTALHVNITAQLPGLRPCLCGRPGCKEWNVAGKDALWSFERMNRAVAQHKFVAIRRDPTGSPIEYIPIDGVAHFTEQGFKPVYEGRRVSYLLMPETRQNSFSFDGG